VTDPENTSATEPIKPLPHGIWDGYRMQLIEAEEATQQKLHPRVADWVPQGQRILVVVDKTPEKIGNIILTDQQRSLERSGAGVIIAVGPTAGLVEPPGHAGTIRCSHPTDLIGAHIAFSYSAGKTLRFSRLVGDYDSEIIILTPLDVWAVDMVEDHWAADLDFEAEYRLTKQGEEDEAAAKLAEARTLAIQARTIDGTS